MTPPPDPKPTAPPTIEPASYDQVKRYLNYHGHINVRMANEIEARIEADRATIAKQAEEIERLNTLLDIMPCGNCGHTPEQARALNSKPEPGR